MCDLWMCIHDRRRMCVRVFVSVAGGGESVRVHALESENIRANVRMCLCKCEDMWQEESCEGAYKGVCSWQEAENVCVSIKVSECEGGCDYVCVTVTVVCTCKRRTVCSV